MDIKVFSNYFHKLLHFVRVDSDLQNDFKDNTGIAEYSTLNFAHYQHLCITHLLKIIN